MKHTNNLREPLIYLMIWEGEFFLKKWYELALLLTGQAYDWGFRIGYNASDNAKGVLTQYAIHAIIRDNLR
ncbi:hypothetical protein [Olivibacter sp. XZL3]|uniref:hypothetical protein n=1 Tax=Olivibacter sp. XZL3 TaxID=1735116 RepID=UPI0010655544|nr:hypothetical protein [Olivibacter sp. XZL3]